MGLGPARRARGRRQWKSSDSHLNYVRGKQKYFAKNYLQMAENDPARVAFRQFLGPNYAGATGPQKVVRNALGYYGKGGYRKYMPYAIRGVGAMGAAALGYNPMQGWEVGGKASKFLGYGDYSTNQIISGGGSGNTNTNISVNSMNTTGDIYISRTEFVQNVVVNGTPGTASSFQTTFFPLNPGMAKTFPWLSQIAQNFTLYEFEGLMFQYKPLFSEDAGTSSSLGKVILATNYDPTAIDFGTSVEMENYDYSNSSKPSSGIVHGVETKNSQQALNMQYVRSGVSTKSLVFTDIGNFQVGSEGIPMTSSSVIIGELWVTYKVKLSRAELFSSFLAKQAQWFTCYTTYNRSTLATGSGQCAGNIAMRVYGHETDGLRVIWPVSTTLGYYQVVVGMDQTTGGNFGTGENFFPPSNAQNMNFYLPSWSVSGAPSTVGSNDNSMAAPFGGSSTGSAHNSTMFYVAIKSPGLTVASFDLLFNWTTESSAGSLYVWVNQINVDTVNPDWLPFNTLVE